MNGVVECGVVCVILRLIKSVFDTGGKNHYVDCPERIENNTTMTLLLDNSRSYILIDCPDWWPPKGSGIDNWWTVAPVDAKWPASYLLPPYNKTV